MSKKKKVIGKYDQFVDWVRGCEKPKSLRVGGWKTWEESARKARPVRYWLATTVLEGAEDLVKQPGKGLRKVRNYISNRWIDKTHYLPTRLKPGGYHEVDERMIHGMFETLVDFVEAECAWMHVIWDDEQRKKYGPKGFRFFKSWRCAEAGIAYLNWSANVINAPAQASSSNEILRLYNWWKLQRPARPCPYDASGWSDYCANSGLSDFLRKKDEQTQKNVDQMLDKLRQLEEQYFEEDTQMLIDLIKIRPHLWT
jgi:hypothetical protein